MDAGSPPVLMLGGLGLDRGGLLLIQRALRDVPVGGVLEVRGRAEGLSVHLRGWCRAQGHALESTSGEMVRIRRGTADSARWKGAEHTGKVAERASERWGLAARGAFVEAGSPAFNFPLCDKVRIWSDDAARLYAQAAAAQWDPETAIPWDAPFEQPDEIEDAVVQVMTYLIENETAALIIPARFASQVHPHFREVMQLLAIQAADEARHMEVFTRRALLRRPSLGLSTAGGQASLKTLVEEPEFELASFLLSVLGEGSFLTLLWFLHTHAPDPVTRKVVRLAAQDEARHVAFGLSHLKRHVGEDPGLCGRLAASVHRRHDTLRHTTGLNEEVFDALVLLAAGRWDPEAIERGYRLVQDLEQAMDRGRRDRLEKLGFTPGESAELSSLHTRNFM